MREKGIYSPTGIEKDLIVEEFIQRYNQYRWEDETRAKFINFYIIFYFAFFAIIGFLSEHESLLKLLPYSDNPHTQYALIFLSFSIIGSIWLISIISFRTVQLLEGRTIRDIKTLSPFLLDNVRYPIDRRIPKTNKLIYSTTPLVFIIFLLNLVTFFLSIYFFNLSCVPYWKNISIYIAAISIAVMIIWARFWRPSESSIRDLDYDKIW